jgi:putative cardiolipin synthase
VVAAVALAGGLTAGLGAGLTGCSTPPAQPQGRPSAALRASEFAPLARAARASVPPGSPSGFRLLAASTHSLQARLALIERAQASLDLQYYVFKGDETGRTVMRALRDAAARGVRVRVLIDDLYTAGDEDLLLGLAAHPGVEVRLFNPFEIGRRSLATRLATALLGSERLHRRMHNKLFVADGAFAIAGGRNLADEYFVRSSDQGFVDFDVLVAGAAVADLAASFDPYWNSHHSFDVRALFGDGAAAEERRRERFAALVAGVCSTSLCVDEGEEQPLPPTGRPPVRIGLGAGRIEMHGGTASALADDPEKVHESTERAPPLQPADLPPAARVRAQVAQAILRARRELVVVSPYLIPGDNGVAAIGRFRERGVAVTLLTNSLAATDEPLVHTGYSRYRAAIVREGAELYEWSPARSGRVFRQLLRGLPVLRLHAKCVVIDREQVYLGSMNFDPRSRDYNTESGLLIHSTALAEEVHALIQDLKRDAAYRVLLADDGRTLLWQAADGSTAPGDFEPDTDPFSRLLLDLLGPFVPEELL